MSLNEKEEKFIMWYRSLTRLEQIAVNALFVYGDDRLVIVLSKTSDRLHRLDYLPHTKLVNQSAFHRR